MTERDLCPEVKELAEKCVEITEDINTMDIKQDALIGEQIETSKKLAHLEGKMWVVIPLLMAILTVLFVVARNGSSV